MEIWGEFITIFRVFFLILSQKKMFFDNFFMIKTIKKMFLKIFLLIIFFMLNVFLVIFYEKYTEDIFFSKRVFHKLGQLQNRNRKT